MLNAFEHWLQTYRIPLEAQGVVFEFCSPTAEQTVKAINLHFRYAQYEGTIRVWETGNCNIDLADMDSDVSEPLDECCSCVDLHFSIPAELESPLSSFCEMLIKLPSKPISARAAMYGYWQSQPSSICQ